MEPVLSFNYLGRALTSQKIVPGDIVTGIAPGVLAYQQYTVAYTSGGTAELKPGMSIVGATSSATGVIVSITLTSGTWAGGTAAGVITLCNSAGTWTANEKVKTGAGTDDATLTGVPVADTSDYEFKGATAKAATIQVLTKNALVQWDGSTPDQTYKRGLTVAAGSSLTIVGPENLRNLKIVDEVSGQASTANVICHFYGPWGAAA